MPARTSELWRQRVFSTTENNPTLGAGRTRALLVEQYGDDNEVPSERTVRSIQEEYRGLPSKERRKYRLVYWPETFERGDLPWAGAEAVLVLLRSMHPNRPTVRFSRWFWHVRQSVSLERWQEFGITNGEGEALGDDHYIKDLRSLAGSLESSELGINEINPERVRRQAESFLLGMHPTPGTFSAWIPTGPVSPMVELMDAAGLEIPTPLRQRADREWEKSND